MIYAIDKNYITDFRALQKQKAELMLTDYFTEPEKPELNYKSGTAIIEVNGSLTDRERWYGTTYQDILSLLGEAESIEDIETIEFRIKSYGGEVDGIEPVVNAIANSPKKTVAKVGYMAASAAYWLASATDEIIATGELANFGSIGVIATAYDYKEYFEKAGIKEIVLTSTNAPKKHVDIASEEGQSDIVARLNKTHEIFAGFVAKQRNTTIKAVNNNFGKGGVLIAKEALAIGMIDKIETTTIGGETMPTKDSQTAESKTLAKDEILKHLSFLGSVDPMKIKANIEADRPYMECLEAYVEERAENKFKKERAEDNPIEPQLNTQDKNKERTMEEATSNEMNPEKVSSFLKNLI